MLGGPANVRGRRAPKKPNANPGDHMANREERQVVATSDRIRPAITVRRGSFPRRWKSAPNCWAARWYGPSDATTNIRARLRGRSEGHSRPDVVLAISTAEDIAEVRRGIPYGFSHGSWAAPAGCCTDGPGGIVPAVRWSHTRSRGMEVWLCWTAASRAARRARPHAGDLPVEHISTYRGYPNSCSAAGVRTGSSTHSSQHDGGWERRAFADGVDVQ